MALRQFQGGGVVLRLFQEGGWTISLVSYPSWEVLASQLPYCTREGNVRVNTWRVCGLTWEGPRHSGTRPWEEGAGHQREPGTR